MAGKIHEMVNSTDQAQSAVAENVRAGRLRRGWRLEDLSAELGAIGYPMSVKVLSKTENGHRAISVADLAAFCKVLGQPASDLMAPGGGTAAPGELVELAATAIDADLKVAQAVEATRYAAEAFDVAKRFELQARGEAATSLDVLSAAVDAASGINATDRASRGALTRWLRRNYQTGDVETVRTALGLRAREGN